MKNAFLLLVAVVAFSATACKKDYECKAKGASGSEITLSCENCTKKDVDAYKQSILDAGYVSVDCTK